MQSFDEINLSPELHKAIAELGFMTPTPIQAAVIPVLLEGRRNMVALAQTGTGKTAAFGIPVLQLVETEVKEVQTVILCPTRELCLQVCRDLKSFAKYAKAVRSVAIYGGASIEMQLKALRNGVHIIVATPGRLHDMLRRGGADLSTARCVVLDEADEMLSMGFEEDLNAIMAAIPDTVQKLLFSATMPKQVERLAAAYMKDPLEITMGSRNAGAENVEHTCYMVHEKDRYLALKRIVDATPSLYGLIFCRPRAESPYTAALLIKDGYSADALHGDLSQIQRDRVMQAFRDRSIRMLVATDVAARGIDVSDLTHVINYQLPDELESYTHRSGRTGRAGKSGVSAVLINMREKWKIQHIEQRIGKRFVFKPVPSGRDVCEAQLLKLIGRAKAVQVDERQIAPFMPQIFEMLEGLDREQLIKHFVSLELNRFLDYYRDASDISVPVEPPRAGRRPPMQDNRRPAPQGERFARPPFRKFQGAARQPAAGAARHPEQRHAGPPHSHPRNIVHAGSTISGHAKSGYAKPNYAKPMARPQHPAVNSAVTPAAAIKTDKTPSVKPSKKQTPDATPEWVRNKKKKP